MRLPDLGAEAIRLAGEDPHVVQAAELGADVVTIPHKVMMQLIRHPLTDIGLENFLADARRAAEERG